MAKDRWLNNSELFIYLNENGIAYDPSVKSFREFINQLGLKNVIYRKKPHFLKSDVDLAIKKHEGKSND